MTNIKKSKSTTITISKETKKKLGLIKINYEYQTYDSLLSYLAKLSGL